MSLVTPSAVVHFAPFHDPKMIGERALRLIKDLIAGSPDLIPPYDHSLVDALIHEMQHFFQLNQKQAQSGDGDESGLTCIQVRHALLLWNKRCLISYHLRRLEMLKSLRWEFGKDLPAGALKNLSENEKDWFKKYCGVLDSYMNQLNDGRGLDLMLQKKPPKRLYVQVRCLKEYGEYPLEDGTSIILSKDSTHFLQLSHCESLIQQAVLEQIST